MVVTAKQQYFWDNETIIKVNRDMSIEPWIIEKMQYMVVAVILYEVSLLQD